METQSVTVGSQVFTYCDRAMTLPRSAVEYMLDTITAWIDALPKEPTYAMKNFGIPSLLVRFDGVIDPSGTFQIFEVQGGPGWVGYAGVANRKFRDLRDDLAKNAWPPIKLVLHSPQTRHDDELWLEQISAEDALLSEDALMNRYTNFREFPPPQRMNLIGRCVKPVYDHHDKRYGLQLGLWRRIDAADIEKISWTKGFVLKPYKLSGSHDVMIWNPNERRGRATRSQIVRTLSERGSMYIQTFIPPMTLDLGGTQYNAFLRPFFGYDPRARKWLPLGGVWTARPQPNLRLHGSSDAISGPLLIE